MNRMGIQLRGSCLQKSLICTLKFILIIENVSIKNTYSRKRPVMRNRMGILRNRMGIQLRGSCLQKPISCILIFSEVS